MSRGNLARGQQVDPDEGGSQPSPSQRPTRNNNNTNNNRPQQIAQQVQGGQGDLPSDPRPDVLKDEHRLLLQLFWARRVIAEDELRALVETVRKELKLAYQPTLEEMTKTINKSLESLKFTIRKTKRVRDGAILFGIVNTAADDIAKAGKPFEIKELATEHKEDGRIKREDAVALHNSVEAEDKDGEKTKLNLGAKQVDDFITQFVAEGWLEESKTDNRYLSLTARTFLELKPLFEPDGEYAGFNCGYL